MKCYFCKSECFGNDPLYSCNNHPIQVHHGTDGVGTVLNIVFFNAKIKNNAIVVYIYPEEKDCRLVPLHDDHGDLVHFNFIPNFTPENLKDKLKTYLPFI